VVLLGDFNFECDARHNGYQLLNALLREYDLRCCDNLAEPAIDYTYFQDTLGRYSAIEDHIFVSSELFCNVICCKTVDSGINLSDHIPINCVMAFNDCVNQSVDTSCNVGKGTCLKLRNKLRWDKGNTELYYYRTGEISDCSI